MKLLLENWKNFINETITFGISKDIDKDTLAKIFKWANVSDTSNIEHIGSASMGSAYRIDQNKVLKITNDMSEANSAGILIKSGLSHPNVYQVYKVGKFLADGRPRYALVLELLQQPTEQMKYAMSSIDSLVRLGRSGEGLYSWGGFGKDPNLDKRIDIIAIDGESRHGYNKEEIKSHIDKLASGLTFLKKNGIRFSDLKASNVLQRDGEPVIIDLGRVGLSRYVDIETID